MCFVAVSWIGSEADIVARFVHYHSRLIDRLIVVHHVHPDQRENDATSRILARLVHEGWPLDVQYAVTPLHDQAHALTEAMAAACARYAPQWILALDADEFLVARVPLPTALATLPEDRVTLVPWRTYVPTPRDDRGERDILRRMRHRRSAEHPEYCKVLVPGAIAREPGVRMGMGSHVLLYANDAQAPSLRTEFLELAHFPVRSAPQLRRKIIGGWAHWKPHPDRREGQGFHWERLAAWLRTEPEIVPEVLQRIALSYAAQADSPDDGLIEDPVPLLPPPAPQRILFIACWMGSLPPIFMLFLETCRRNTGVHWLIVTDQDIPADVPPNVRFLRMTFGALQERFGSVLGEAIRLANPYKICDCKPLYGAAFRDALCGYTHWGVCDVDVLWGDIRSFLTDDLLRCYDIVSTGTGWISGACSVFRHTETLLHLWQDIPRYRELLADSAYRSADEWILTRSAAQRRDITALYRYSQYCSLDAADVFWVRGHLRGPDRDAMLFHCFRWKDMPFDVGALRAAPAWRIGPRSVQPSPVPCATDADTLLRERGVVTAAGDEGFVHCMRLLLSLRAQSDVPACVFDCGLTEEQQTELHRISGIEIRSMPWRMVQDGRCTPSYLLGSPYPSTLWMDPRCHVPGDLLEAFHWLECHMFCATDSQMYGGNTVSTHLFLPASAHIVGCRPHRPWDAQFLRFWMEEWSGGQGSLDRAIRRCGDSSVVLQNGRWSALMQERAPCAPRPSAMAAALSR